MNKDINMKKYLNIVEEKLDFLHDWGIVIIFGILILMIFPKLTIITAVTICSAVLGLKKKKCAKKKEDSHVTEKKEFKYETVDNSTILYDSKYISADSNITKCIFNTSWKVQLDFTNIEIKKVMLVYKYSKENINSMCTLYLEDQIVAFQTNNKIALSLEKVYEKVQNCTEIDELLNMK